PHLQRFKRAIELCKVFGTRNIRVFSYYLPEHGEWDNWRRDVLDRTWEAAKLAQKAGVRLIHENEHGIYGDDPERVKDLMATVLKQMEEWTFAPVYYPANYVVDGFDPIKAWQMTKQWTVHFHIKDWIVGEKHGAIAGTGQGRIPEVMKDAVAM